MQTQRITLKSFMESALENKEHFPKWFIDIVEDQRCNWVPDSKGGEPNFKK